MTIAFVIVAIIVAILLIVAVDKIAVGLGANGQLILIVQGLIVLLVALLIAQKAGLV
jgi:hypothetical protein